ncbi:MAG: T9SS type A sorting domain-containing protein [Flavobacteriales bacterium]|nr:T9SS type A sorting domain-containing protein [Flavobacteriales bacterium]
MRFTRAFGLLLLFICSFSNWGNAQERFFDMLSNPALFGSLEKAQREYQLKSSRAAGDTLDLPFFDDFSEPFSRLRTAADLYPNQDLWQGYTVYINNHMAINPISQGVATFDGLDENGRAYGFGFSLPFLADSLTSNPLNLAGADSVYLSFYYQAQGLGNAPEEEDILALEFKSRPNDTTETWVRVWEVDGYTLEDFDFNRVMLPVTGSEYLYNGFQFRFMNYASRAGSVDHWHIDYVELDEGRSEADTIIHDVAGLSQTSFVPGPGALQSASYSLLKEFSAMPWTHYKTDSIGAMGDTAYVVLRNNDDSDVPTNFSLKVLDRTGGLLYDVLSSTATVVAGRICGNESNTCNTTGGASNFLYNISSGVPYFPSDSEISEDSAYFELKFVLGPNDDFPVNDVRVEKQEFYNYYAYDDGTAEVGYGLGELENEGMVAVKYNVKKEDILRAIQLYLLPVEYDLSQELVELAIWDGNDQPETLLWSSPEPIALQYTYQRNYFYHYFLESELPIQAGQNIWIGWIQQPATDLKFSVGFDQRTDNSSKNYYNLGTIWNQSSIPGSIMIRPVFGQQYSWTGVEEVEEPETISVYPNPTTGSIQVQGLNPSTMTTVQITTYDLSGREVQSQTGYHGSIELGHLHAGTYLLNIRTAKGTSFTKRVVVQ